MGLTVMLSFFHAPEVRLRRAGGTCRVSDELRDERYSVFTMGNFIEHLLPSHPDNYFEMFDHHRHYEGSITKQYVLNQAFVISAPG